MQQSRAERVRTVERKILVGTIVVFFFLGAYLTGGSLILATVMLAAVSTGCLLRPVAERIVSRDLSLYTLLDPPGDDGPRLSGARLRQLERYAGYADRDDGQDA